MEVHWCVYTDCGHKADWTIFWYDESSIDYGNIKYACDSHIAHVLDQRAINSVYRITEKAVQGNWVVPPADPELMGVIDRGYATPKD